MVLPEPEVLRRQVDRLIEVLHEERPRLETIRTSREAINHLAPEFGGWHEALQAWREGKVELAEYSGDINEAIAGLVVSVGSVPKAIQMIKDGKAYCVWYGL